MVTYTPYADFHARSRASSPYHFSSYFAQSRSPRFQ